MYDLPFLYDYINAETSRQNPNTIHVNNNDLNVFFERYLLQRAMSVFKWDLPENWDKNYFLYILYCYGYIAVVNTDKFGVICQQCGLQGYNVYYQPTTAVITNPLLTGILTPRIGRECEIIRLQPNYCGILDIVQYYANFMALASETAAIDMNNSKVSYVFGASDKQSAESFKKMFDQINSGNPAVFIDKKLYNDDGSTNWQVFNQDVSQTYIVPQILDDMRTLEERFDTEIGIPTANTEKKERLIRDEVNSNNVETTSKVALWLEMLQESCKNVKKMFGVNISVDWRYTPDVERSPEDARDTINGRTV